MKKKTWFTKGIAPVAAMLTKGFAVITAMFALAFTACPQPDSGGGNSGNSGAAITAITIAGEAVTTVPDAVTKAVWESDEFDLFSLESNQTGAVIVDLESSLNDAAVSVTASSGAKVKYAAATMDKPASADFAALSTLTLANNGYLCIQVTSEDGGTVNYYVVEIRIKNTVTSISSLTIGGITAVTGTSNADYTAIATAGSVGLSASTKDNAKVEAVKSNSMQTIEYAKLPKDSVDTPQFAATDTFDFADGDTLYIKVVAENGVTTGYYKILVEIGRDTSIATLSIGGLPVTDAGTPAATAAAATAGSVLFTTAMPSEGYAVAITTTDPDASVKWALGTGGNAQGVPTAYDTTSPIQFMDEGFLYVEVTAANNTTTAYYKVKINLLMSATIKYGSPSITSGTVDSLWDSVTETYRIAKVSADQLGSLENTQATFGIAKAMFDEDGLYIYVDITDPDVDTTGSSAHTKDSVELFINEGVNTDGSLIKTPQSYADKGGQYRVDADGGISGDPATVTTAINPAKVSAWTKLDNTGYIVIFQAPWRFTDLYPLANGKKIGFELQINACSAGGRDGILVWNNVANSNYQNVTNYGEAVLDANGHTFMINAKNPDISVHPVGKTYVPGVSQTPPHTMEVAAASTDGGDITYQWYSNTANAYTGGTLIAGATQTTYTPTINFSADGDYYFWAEVTNTITDNSDGGNKTATRNSGIAHIKVSTVALVEKIYTGGNSVPMYRFTLPAGGTWGDYNKLTFSVMIADQSVLDIASNVRAHIIGNVPASAIDTAGIWSKTSGWGEARMVTISNGGSTKSIVGEAYQLYSWKALESNIVSTNSGYVPATYYPADDATGPFFFGLGLSGQNTTTYVTYYIKDVALVKADGTKLYADDISTAFGSTTLGQLKCKLTDVVPQRTLEAEPSAPGGQ